MPIVEIINLFKKKGFRDTFQILAEAKGNKRNKHAFYRELNKFSYYNSFFRIKQTLLEKGLIKIENKNHTDFFSLTKKGKDVYNKLVELGKLIHD